MKSKYYVIKCIKDVDRQKGAIGPLGKSGYKKGQYVTYNWNPTYDINKSYIFDLDLYHKKDLYYGECFKTVPVKVITIVEEIEE